MKIISSLSLGDLITLQVPLLMYKSNTNSMNGVRGGEDVILTKGCQLCYVMYHIKFNHKQINTKTTEFF